MYLKNVPVAGMFSTFEETCLCFNGLGLGLKPGLSCCWTG